MDAKALSAEIEAFRRQLQVIVERRGERPLEALDDSLTLLRRLIADLQDVEGEVREREEALRALHALHNEIDAARAADARLFEEAADAVLRIAPDGCIETVNRAAERMFGYTRDELTGQPVELLVPEELRERHTAHRADYYTRPQLRSMGVGLDLKARCKDGSVRSVEVSLIPSAVRGGVRVTCVIRDVTERRRAEEALRQASQAKSELVSFLSHELRAPITTIYGDAHLLREKRESFGEEEREYALVDIEEESERMKRVIDNMLSLMLTEEGAKTETEPVAVAPLVQRVVSKHVLRNRHRRVDVSIEAKLPPAEAEPTYLEQVLVNLITNAEKYSPTTASIDISVYREREHITLLVLDRGEGLAPEDYETLFKAYYRAPTTAHMATGAGIGLAVSRRLIEAQGGEIWARPRESGGSIFGITLPVAEE